MLNTATKIHSFDVSWRVVLAVAIVAATWLLRFRA